MTAREFLDILLPGDDSLGVPAFSECDDKSYIESFIASLPAHLAENLENINVRVDSPENILKQLKDLHVDVHSVISEVLYFYFSRPAVVVPLTMRPVPLSSSGMAMY